VLLNFFLFILLTPVFSQSIMRSMFPEQATGQADEALDRPDRLLDFPLLPPAANPKPVKAFDVTFKRVSFRYPAAST
jgi:ATP-binding cassette subfamily B protein